MKWSVTVIEKSLFLWKIYRIVFEIGWTYNAIAALERLPDYKECNHSTEFLQFHPEDKQDGKPLQLKPRQPLSYSDMINQIERGETGKFWCGDTVKPIL